MPITNTALPQARLHSLTSLRFFAASIVVIHHLFDTGQTHVVHLGYLGVTFFFVLSGFVLTWAGSADRGAAVSYQNRFARIYPLHMFCLLAAAILVPSTAYDSALTFVENLSLTQAWDYPRALSFNYVSWSISCEAFFYLMFPLLLLGIRRLPIKLLLPSALAVWVLQGMVAVYLRQGNFDIALVYFPLLRLPEFVIGICLAQALMHGWRPTAMVKTGACVAAVLGAAMIVAGDSGTVYVTRALNSWAALPLVVLILWFTVSAELEGRGRLLQHPWLRLLGEWSFALYMTHALVLRVLSREFGIDSQGGFPVWSGLPIMLVCVAIAAVAHRYVERPAEKLLRSRKTRDRKSAEVPGQLVTPTPASTRPQPER